MTEAEPREGVVVAPEPLNIGRELGEAAGRVPLGAIPFAGGLATEVFQHAVSRGRQGRIERWVADVTDSLNRLLLEPRGVTFEALADDDGFLDAIGAATRAAVETADVVKVRALRNAVLKSAFQPDASADRRVILMDILVGLTPSHIKVLEVFAAPTEWLTAHGLSPKSNISMGSARIVIEQAYPDLARDGVLLDRIVKDLKDCGLADIPLHVTMTGGGIHESRTLALGTELLTDIAEPEGGLKHEECP